MRTTGLALVACLGISLSHAQPLRIGEINSYAAFPTHLEPYRKGWRLAQEELNAAGGVKGRRIEVIAHDDGMRAEDAVRVAARLAENDKVEVLMGGFTSTVSVALAGFALERRIVYLATMALTDELAGARGNRYTFTLRPSGAIQASMLLPEALKLAKRRWAIVYPHNMYDYAAIQSFRMRLMHEQPSVDVVYEQVVPLGQIDAWGVVRWLEDNSVQAVLSLLFGRDLRDLIAEGHARGLLDRLQVLNPLAGQPEDLAFLRVRVPHGWWVTGYPAEEVDYGPHKRFAAQYRKRWGEAPAAGSLYGYTAVMALAQAVRRAGSAEGAKLATALKEVNIAAPTGPLQWRKDRRSTLGAFVGQLDASTGAMAGWRYEPGERHAPIEP